MRIVRLLFVTLLGAVAGVGFAKWVGPGWALGTCGALLLLLSYVLYRQRRPKKPVVPGQH